MNSFERPPQEPQMSRREALKKIGKGILGAGLMASGIGSLANKAEAGFNTVPQDKTRPDSDKGIPRAREEETVVDPVNPDGYVAGEGKVYDPVNPGGYVAGEGKVYDPNEPKTPTESPAKIPGVELGPNGKFNRKPDGSLEIQDAIIRK